MNIWDSVHRGLEKASHEAARIARVQRLRTTIDTLNRQVYTQQGTLLARTMEAFHEGRLIQSELLPLCQELATLQQQLEQAQNELKQPQNQGPMTASPSSAPTTPITAFVSDPLATTQPEPMYQMYADQAPPPPPPYQPYATPTIPVPPPPPSLEPVDLGSMETQAIERETPNVSVSNAAALLQQASSIARIAEHFWRIEKLRIYLPYVPAIAKIQQRERVKRRTEDTNPAPAYHYTIL